MKRRTGKLRHSIGLFLFSILAGSAVFAADVQMTIQPELISLLDRAVLKIVFTDTSGQAIDIPDLDGLGFTYQGQSQETHMVNFKTTRKVVHTYLITPAKVGDYTIGPITAQFKGGEKELTGKLRVIKPKDDKAAQEISELMYSEISSDRQDPHVHEPFGLTLKIFIRDGIQTQGSFSISEGMPESGLDGDVAWEVVERKRQEINGSIFNVYTAKAKIKTLTAGSFAFQPQVKLNVVVPRQNRRSYGFDDPFFGDFFGRQETRQFVLDCNRLEVNVQPVPMDGRPDSFTGGVGIFDFDVDVGPVEVKAGEPITVRMTIAGKGNLSQITPPFIDESLDFKVYDARTVPTDQSNAVQFEQVLIPNSDAVTNIPEIAFSYFNTKTTDFRTIKQGPFPVTVEAVPQQTAQVIATVPTTVQLETKVLGRDIVYLKPLPEKWKTTEDIKWYAADLFKVLIGIPALLLLIISLTTARRSILDGNEALARRQQAPKAARKQLQRAEQAIRKKDEAEFYSALWDALIHYFGNRLNLAPGDVTAQAVRTRIPSEAETIDRLFNTVEQRRYGLGDRNAEEMKPLLKEMMMMMRKCERVKS